MTRRRRPHPAGRLLRVLLFCLALASLAPRSAGASRALAPLDRDPRFGVVEAWRSPALASTIGVGWERVGFWWKEMQPSGPLSWNPFATGHDHAIDSEIAAGRQVVGLLINTPDWAAVQPSEHGASVPKGLYLPYNDPRNYWGHFVSLMAGHYAGRIDDWIIWNEVSIPSGQWHTWDGTTADYARLVVVAYQAARAVNPRARIVLAGDPYWYDHGAFFNALLGDLTQMPGAAANGAYFDVANLHLYSRPTDIMHIVAFYRSLLARHGLTKPIWIAETNAIPYNDPVRRYPRGGFFATLNDQASFIIEAYAIALTLGVERIEVNRMVDGPDFTAGGEPLGLVRNDGSIRPAFYAYRTVSALFSHVTGGTIAFNAVTGVYTVTLRKPGAVVTVIWDQRPAAATATVPARGTSGLVYTKSGYGSQARPIAARYTFPLAPSTGNTDSANPRDYVIGGSPLILVQPSTH